MVVDGQDAGRDERAVRPGVGALERHERGPGDATLGRLDELRSARNCGTIRSVKASATRDISASWGSCGHAAVKTSRATCGSTVPRKTPVSTAPQRTERAIGVGDARELARQCGERAVVEVDLGPGEVAGVGTSTAASGTTPSTLT